MQAQYPNMYQNQFQQAPIQQQRPQQQQYIIPPQVETVVHVTSEADMATYPIAPGNTVYFINDAAECIYKREVNMYGTQLLPEVYDFKKRATEPPKEEKSYVTREEVEDIILNLLTAKEAKPNAKQPSK